MRRLFVAIRAFFQVLFRGETARQVERVLLDLKYGRQPERALTETPAAVPPTAPAPAKPKPTPAPKVSARSDAITLLAALQREARFVDFVMEPINNYTDAQIGAAARDVHRECGKVIERMFAPQPLVDEQEGAAIEVSGDTERYRLVGHVTGEPPYRGTLMHHGWLATTSQVPVWTGHDDAARIVAPAEVELK